MADDLSNCKQFKAGWGFREGQSDQSLENGKAANVRSGQSRSAKSANVESGLITVRKMDSGSVIALHQLADRTDFVRIVLAALSVRSLPVGFDLDEDPVSHLRVNDYRFDSGDFHIVRVEPGRK